MKNKILSAIFCCSVLISTSVYTETLTILNWEEYLSDEAIKAWEEKTGHTIKQIYFDNDEARDSYLVKSELEGIDIAVMDEPASQLFGEANKFEQVNNFTQADNLKHLGKFWRERCGAYSVPYLWGTIGLVYRNDVFDEPPSSWKVLLDPKESLKGHFSYLKDSIDTFAPALFTLGFEVNTENKNQLKQAFELTKNITPHLLTLDYPITYVSASPEGSELHLGVAYSGDQWVMNDATNSDLWSYTVPEEGTIVWVDCFAVLEKSKNKNLAIDFINFISSPEVAAKNSEELYVASTNESAKKLQSEEMLNDETVYPKEDIIARSQYYEPISAENYRLRSRMASALLKLYESK